MTPRFDLLGLVVQDMARSVAFYRALGLAFPDGAEGEGHVEAALPGGLRFALDTLETIRSFDPRYTPPTGSPRASLAFLCASSAEVDALYAQMTHQNFHGHKAPWDAFWGQRYAVLHDPDGNGVDLFAPL